ncbi:hypothetical protein GT022_20055 [Agaribacter marinus]|uniref:Uncharacterized protein n=1 Tax=Virgibacillus salarius TaxID=447199 RepID=A0A941E228_9BACI|nr:hypothetical protein [Virgibacillus salarius]MBR7798298.1 hypothetical protein [Virgibacillus salarius]NAZ11007.1 hypothetical protein [Agaribacter marinus]
MANKRVEDAYKEIIKLMEGYESMKDMDTIESHSEGEQDDYITIQLMNGGKTRIYKDSLNAESFQEAVKKGTGFFYDDNGVTYNVNSIMSYSMPKEKEDYSEQKTIAELEAEEKEVIDAGKVFHEDSDSHKNHKTFSDGSYREGGSE